MAQTIEAELDAPRELMYEEMSELVGEDQLEQILTNQINGLITNMYDQMG